MPTGYGPGCPCCRPSAPTLPTTRGKDSGHASWRSVEHARWPKVGPAPVLEEAEYEHLASTLVRTGTILDRRMIYGYARPSEHVPTLEIRVADTNADLDVVILLVALVRGLATTFCAEIADSRPAPLLPLASLQEAHRLAALHGLSGDGLDPLCGIYLPPWRLVERLRERVAPALDASTDLPLVDTVLDDLSRTGDGAARQRHVYSRCGRLADIVDALATSTTAQAAA
ncbi:glutamate-cysteine ligase family protein [Streptomyces sp. NPDC093093]|uniref:carboxylate-amine ligase n=1 Tax=Streptomyces sp. NPDC093093 TaxID=3366025 RepID=UPI00380CBD11